MAFTGEKRNVKRGCLVLKHEGKRPPVKPRRGWDDSIEVGLMSIRWEDVDWIHLGLISGFRRGVNGKLDP